MKKEIKKEKVKKVQVEITPEIRALFDGYHKETEQEMKQYIAGLAEESDRKTERYIGALSENFQHGLSAVAEQFTGLNEKIDDIKRTQDSHTEMIGVMMEDITVLKEDVSEIKEELKTKADKTEVIHISRRVSVLEHTS